MDADLDTLCTVVYCTADDLLPERQGNARRRVTDAEIVTLCVAQAIMGIPSDRRFLAVGRQAPRPSVPDLPSQPAYFKRRRRLADAIEWLMASSPPRAPVPGRPAAHRLHPGGVRAQPRDGQARSALAEWPTTATAPPTRAASGAFACTPSSPPTAPPGAELASPKRDEREVGLGCLSAARGGGEILLATRATPGATSPPAVETGRRHRASGAQDEPRRGLHLAPIRQRIESIFWTAKDLLTLERHGARTMAGLRERIVQRFCCLAACVTLNHQSRPSQPLLGLLLCLTSWNQSSRRASGRASARPPRRCGRSRCRPRPAARPAGRCRASP